MSAVSRNAFSGAFKIAAVDLHEAKIVERAQRRVVLIAVQLSRNCNGFGERRSRFIVARELIVGRAEQHVVLGNLVARLAVLREVAREHLAQPRLGRLRIAAREDDRVDDVLGCRALIRARGTGDVGERKRLLRVLHRRIVVVLVALQTRQRRQRARTRFGRNAGVRRFYGRMEKRFGAAVVADIGVEARQHRCDIGTQCGLVAERPAISCSLLSRSSCAVIGFPFD